jgi:hypothetical protein
MNKHYPGHPHNNLNIENKMLMVVLPVLALQEHPEHLVVPYHLELP